MTAESRTFDGSCFCGKVRYRVAGPLGVMSNCHCTDCRKSHAAAFATYIDAPRKDFAFLQGEDHLATFEAPSGTKRSFCRTCGSIVVCFVDSDPKTIEIAAATLDTPFDKRPEYHIFVRSKVAWYDIQDGRPQHQAYSK
jgi:hypothetical protein